MADKLWPTQAGIIGTPDIELSYVSTAELSTLRARIAELEAENARLKIECLNGANHLEGIDTSGPGRKRMQSARMWIYQARQLAGEREG